MPLRAISAQRFERGKKHYVRAVIDHPDVDDLLTFGPLSEANARALTRIFNEVPCDITYNGSGPFGLAADGEEQVEDAVVTFAFPLYRAVRVRYGEKRGEMGTIQDRWRASEREPAYLLSIEQEDGIQTGIWASDQIELV